MSVVKVYRYGLLAPTENRDLVAQTMRLAHEYRNKLVEIDRQERAEIRALQTSHGSIPALEAAAKAAIQAKEAAYAAIKAHKQQDRTRKVPEPLKAAYQSAKQVAFDASRSLYQARAALKADPTIALRRDEINVRYGEIRKKARASCGVYWGTYLRVEAADQQARKTTPLWDGVDPNDVRFARWRGDGAVGLQMKEKPSPSDLPSSRWCKIEVRGAPKGADPTSKRSAKRSYCTLALRVGSEEREPIWARWPMVMHRPLPDDAEILWVTVTLRNIGPRQEWAVLFTVRYEDKRQVPPAEPVDRIGVDIGWRKLEGGGVRVAAWRTDSGAEGELVLDERMLGQARKADDLRSIRDMNLDAARAALVAALPGMNLPDWFPKNVWQWRSAARFSNLAKRWKQNRFPGDDLPYAQLEAWRYHDHHLWAWETSQRTKALRHRLDVYRNFAAGMAKKHTGLVVEKFDLREVAALPEAHQQEGDNQQARTQRQRSATSELRMALTQAFAGRTKEVPAAYTTQTCSACGAVEKWDQAAELEHTCSACGARWDQDFNAARNLLAYVEQSGGPENGGVARDEEKPNDGAEVQESKWAKAKRMGKEKRDRVDTARGAVDNAAE